MSQLILFDVNETLLDLAALDPHFSRAFGTAAAPARSPAIDASERGKVVRQQWFAQLLQSALVATITSDYHDFGALARHALSKTAAQQNVTLTDADSDAILGAVRTLPPHPEVPAALAELQAAGFRLATLTNSPPPVLAAQMANAGLDRYFERLLSVHPTHKFKPAREPYAYAAAELAVPIEQIWMVAAHDWDIAGARAVGMRGAFVARPGMVLGPLQERPEIVGADLAEVVQALQGQN